MTARTTSPSWSLQYESDRYVKADDQDTRGILARWLEDVKRPDTADSYQQDAINEANSRRTE